MTNTLMLENLIGENKIILKAHNHVHPAGNFDDVGFVPEPSDADYHRAEERSREKGINGQSYVLSNGNGTVYIYNVGNNGKAHTIATFPLQTFIKRMPNE